jgi:XTP/dITP diphosphohydrolase
VNLLVATTNTGKLAEIGDVLARSPVQLLSLADVPPLDEPEETETTFEGNARLKARHYAARTGLMTVADDSGLVIDGLGGEPGVRSARFLRPNATYAERFAEIERRLKKLPDAARRARFICAVAVVQDDRVLFEATGTIEGTIARVPAGSGGFGYDPIFYYPPYDATLAEVNREAKLRVAHRGQAFRAVAEWLETCRVEQGRTGM